MNLRELWRKARSKKKEKEKKAKKSKKKPASPAYTSTAVSIQLLKQLFNYLDRREKLGQFFLAWKERGRGCGLINCNQYLIRCMNVVQITISRTSAFSLSAISFQKVNPVGVNCESPEECCQLRVLVSLALIWLTVSWSCRLLPGRGCEYSLFCSYGN